MRAGMEKIRRDYGVPAKRGMKVKYDGLTATILSGNGQYLRLRFEGGSTSLHHPLYLIDYLDGVDYAAQHDARVKAVNQVLNECRQFGEQQGEVG